MRLSKSAPSYMIDSNLVTHSRLKFYSRFYSKTLELNVLSVIL